MADQKIDIEIRARAILAEAQKQIGALVQDLDKANTNSKKAGLTLGDMAKTATIVGGAVTGLAAGVGALGARGADIADLRDSFHKLNLTIGNDSTAVLQQLRESFAGTVSDADLFRIANEALGAGLKANREEFGLIADAARIIADRTGKDATQAFNSLAMAMANGRTKAAEMLVGVIDNEAAMARYAVTHGKLVKDMTEAEKVEAARIAILDKLRQTVENNGKAQVDFADKVDQSKAKIKNVIDATSEWIATRPGLTQWATVATGAASAVTLVGAAVGPLKSGVMTLIPLLGLQGLAGAMGAARIATLGFAASLGGPLIAALAAVAGGLMLANNESFIQGVTKWAASSDSAAASAARWAFGIGTLTKEQIAQAEANIKATEEAKRSKAAQDELAKSTKLLEDAQKKQLEADKAALEQAQKDAAALQKREEAQKAAAAAAKQHAEALKDLRDSMIGGDVIKKAQLLMEAFKDSIPIHTMTAEKQREIRDILLAATKAWELQGVAVPASVSKQLAAVLDLKAIRDELAELERAPEGLGNVNDGGVGQQAHDREMRWAEEERTADDAVRQARVETNQIIRDASFRRAEHDIEMAKRQGRAWQEIYAMEADLRRAKVEAAIADSEREFREKVADLRRTRTVSEQEYEAMRRAHEAQVGAMREDFLLGEQAKRDEIRRTHDVFFRAWEEGKAILRSVTDRAADAFTDMLTRGKSFKDGMKGIWDGIKQDALDIFRDILHSFINSFLKGLLGAITGQRGAFQNAFAGLFGGGFGGGGIPGMGGGGGIFGGAGGFLPSLLSKIPGLGFLGGAAAAGTSAMTLAPGLVAGLNAQAGFAGAAGAAGGGGLMGGLGALMTNPWTIGIAAAAVFAPKIWDGLKALGNAFRSEGAKTNDSRDKWFAQFQSVFGGDQYSAYLAAAQAAKFDAETAQRLVTNIYQASDRDRLREAQRTANDAFAQAGMPGLQVFHMGGMVRGTGEVLAKLLPGERVLNHVETMAYNRAMNASGGVSLTIAPNAINIVARDGDQADAIAKEVLIQVLNFFRQNHGGALSSQRLLTTGRATLAPA